MMWEQRNIQALLDDDIMCPICLKSLLREVHNFVVCQCGLRLPAPMGLNVLKKNIQEQVKAHSAVCLDLPKFSIFQDENNVSLHVSCMSCEFFELV